MKCTLITALIICSLGWISVSAADSQTVEVQSGEEVTLTCSNSSNYPTVWFRVVNRTKASWISTMMGSEGTPSYCDRCQSGKFEMSSNTSAAFLKMKTVAVSDSGQYFCVVYRSGRTVFTTIRLNVEESDYVTKLVSVILGGLTGVLLTVIIALVVTITKLQKAASEKQNPPQRENPGSDDLNYAAVAFRQKGRRREVEENVVYSSTR